uniref:RRM domain-containing protein n=1 Tax=Ananas comosus var. bracteatus TaxID=296719 RepID=A0A6V7PS26_ANACO|nr:unnamed protein product [Ananas comosus var. bracteatus]
MPGLTFSNKLISRDEGLHCDFACLLYSLLRSAAARDPRTLDEILSAADADPFNSKLFVHGLGWETTSEGLRAAFARYDEIEDYRVGFIQFRSPELGEPRPPRTPKAHRQLHDRVPACLDQTHPRIEPTRHRSPGVRSMATTSRGVGPGCGAQGGARVGGGRAAECAAIGVRRRAACGRQQRALGRRHFR